MSKFAYIEEAQSADRVKALTLKKIQQRAGRENRTAPRRVFGRLAGVAAAIVITLPVATVALAATGVLDNLFAAITEGGPLYNASRETIVEQDFAAILAPISESGDALTLNAYYADGRELGFDFTLSGVELEDGVSLVRIRDFEFQMKNTDGSESVWKWHSGEDAQRREFPGGHYVSDTANHIQEYEPGADFSLNAETVKIAENTYDISVVVRFRNDSVPIGDSARMVIGGLDFLYSVPSPDLSTPDRVVTVDGVWAFDIDIEDRFAEVEELVYAAANDEANGITIHSVTVLPTVCRVEASIDYSKNTLANPDNPNIVSEPKFVPKLDVMDTALYAVDADGNRYAAYEWGVADDEPLAGGAVRCWFELDSMYFNMPETLTLRFEGHRDTVIEIPDVALTLGE